MAFCNSWCVMLVVQQDDTHNSIQWMPEGTLVVVHELIGFVEFIVTAYV
jgi:hypothetical protein